jgi:hypothetical protein
MKTLAWLVVSFVLLASTTGCKVGKPSLSDDGPERSCTPPRLSVVGHERGHGPLTVRPGQTLRLHGVHYTDDCAAGGAGTGQTIARLQLILQSVHHVGALATVHPRGATSSFSVSVTIPPGTAAGPATIFDALAPKHHVVHLVVRP